MKIIIIYLFTYSNLYRKTSTTTHKLVVYVDVSLKKPDIGIWNIHPSIKDRMKGTSIRYDEIHVTFHTQVMVAVSICIYA